MQFIVNKWFTRLGALLTLVLLIGSCSKFEIETPSISVDFSPANPNIGDTVIFTVSHDAQFLAVFPGDPGHEWARSRGKAILDGGDDQNEFLREMTPNTENFFLDFRRLGAAGESIPSEIQTNNLNADFDFDPIYTLTALRLSNPSNNVDSAAIAIVNPASYLWGENKDLEMDIRATDSVNMELTIYLEIGGIMADSSISWILEVGGDPIDFLTYEGEPAEFQDDGLDFALEPLVDKWVADNPALASDSLEVTQVIITFRATDDSPNPWADMFISFVELGFPDLRPFDTGFNVAVDNLSGTQQFGYIYDQEGSFTATFIATNVDYISRDVDYRDGREPSADEYDFLRTIVDVVIDVSP